MAFLAGLARIGLGAARVGAASESAAASGVGARGGSLFGSSEIKTAENVSNMAPRHGAMSQAQHNASQEPLKQTSLPQHTYDVAVDRGGEA